MVCPRWSRHAHDRLTLTQGLASLVDLGSLVAAGLVWSGMGFKSVILWSIIPSAISVLSIAALTRDRDVLFRSVLVGHALEFGAGRGAM